jgi:hypothetical protein
VRLSTSKDGARPSPHGRREAVNPKEYAQMNRRFSTLHFTQGPIRTFDGDAGGGGGTGGTGDGGGNGDGQGGQGDGGATDESPVAKLERAIVQERAATKAARDELRGYKSVTREAGIANPDALREALGKGGGGSGQSTGQQAPQVDVDKIRREAESKATTAARAMIALSKIEARASGKFADPDDVVSHFKESASDFVGDDGNPDVKAIDRELDRLAAAKPHWVKQQDNGARDFDGGARGTAGAPSDMNSWLRAESRRKSGR